MRILKHIGKNGLIALAIVAIVVVGMFVRVQWAGEQAEAAFEIDASARFNDDDSAYLSRTLASAGNRKTWTFSAWVKRANLGTSQKIFSAFQDGSNAATIEFTSTDEIQYTNAATSINGQKKTSAVFRDPAAWVHVVVAIDTTHGTAANRNRLYVDGQEITSFATDTNHGLNDDTYVNATVAHSIGRQSSASGHFDGYLSDVYLIDGQQLTPTSFGETDSSGYWRPKAYTGTYGTNGFHLDFASNSDLGNDVSGQNNDWTVNSMDATDWVVDTPTNGYATGNSIQPSSGTFSQGNLQNAGTVRGNVQIPSTGVWYWEVYANGSGVSAGIIDESGTASTTSVTNGETFGFAFDADNDKLYYTPDGTQFFLHGSGFTGNDYFPYATGGSSIINYGQSKNPVSTSATTTLDSAAGGYFKYDLN